MSPCTIKPYPAKAACKPCTELALQSVLLKAELLTELYQVFVREFWHFCTCCSLMGMWRAHWSQLQLNGLSMGLTCSWVSQYMLDISTRQKGTSCSSLSDLLWGSDSVPLEYFKDPEKETDFYGHSTNMKLLWIANSPHGTARVQ